MRAILHIGTEKTGSSSIQSLLRKNRSALRRQGYQTSRELGRPSQIALAVAALPTDVRWRVHRRLSLDTDEDVRAYRVDRRSALEKELAGRDGTLLLSCEQLSKLPDEQSVVRLTEWLSCVVSQVTALVYVRRQDSFLVSLYSQALKSGRTAPLDVPDEVVAGAGSKFDYWSLVSRWANVLGPDRVVVRVFERDALVGGDVVKDYLDVVGMHPEVDLAMPSRRNPRLDATGAEFLRLLNHHIPSRSHGRDALRGDVSPTVTRAAQDGPPLAMDPAEGRAFVARFAAGNSKVARRYLGRPDGRLFSDEFPRGQSEGQMLSVERAAEISAAMWMHKQQQYTDVLRRLRQDDDGQGDHDRDGSGSM